MKASNLLQIPNLLQFSCFVHLLHLCFCSTWLHPNVFPSDAFRSVRSPLTCPQAIAKAKDMHPKLAAGMYGFFALGALGTWYICCMPFYLQWWCLCVLRYISEVLHTIGKQTRWLEKVDWKSGLRKWFEKVSVCASFCALCTGIACVFSVLSQTIEP
jgi:hypothetical protein